MRKETYVYHDLKVSDKLLHDNKLKVLAYRIETDHLVQCFLRSIDTKLVHPAEFSVGELNKSREEFIKVSEEYYDKYLDIVHGRSRVPLRSLERLI